MNLRRHLGSPRSINLRPRPRPRSTETLRNLEGGTNSRPIKSGPPGMNGRKRASNCTWQYSIQSLIPQWDCMHYPRPVCCIFTTKGTRDFIVDSEQVNNFSETDHQDDLDACFWHVVYFCRGAAFSAMNMAKNKSTIIGTRRNPDSPYGLCGLCTWFGFFSFRILCPPGKLPSLYNWKGINLDFFLGNVFFSKHQRKRMNNIKCWIRHYAVICTPTRGEHS